jgi:hypothetical protein
LTFLESANQALDGKTPIFALVSNKATEERILQLAKAYSH